MKKFSFFLMGALAMAFAACEDAPETAPMQQNPQEPVLEGSNVAVTAAGALADPATAVNLETLKSEPVEIFTETALANIPAGATMSYDFYLSKSEDLADAQVLPVALNGKEGFVSPVEWNDAHVALFGKSPKVKTAYYGIAAYATLNGVKYRVGGQDYFVARGEVKESCFDLGFTISDSYYLIGGMQDWQLTADGLAPYKFNHSDADVYDDPVFTLVVEIPTADCYWKIVPQEAIADQNWAILYGAATDGATDFEGMLIGGADNLAQAGKIVDPGKYRFTINMEEMTYKIEPITRPEFVAVPSNANGWNQSGPQLWWSNKDDKPYFCGAAVVNNNDGGFKFIWDNNWYGGADGTIDPAGGNIKAPEDGNQLYWFIVSTENMTYQMTPVTSVGVVGGLNGWSDSAPIELTPDASLLKWSADVALTGEWKIIINHSWNSSYGGPNLSEATFDGPNISGYEGNYTVTMDFSNAKPAIVLTAK